jgi:small GTP-binding protein
MSHVRLDGSAFKVAFIGPCGSGKTSIIHRFHDGSFTTRSDSTIGASFITHDMLTPCGNISLNIWDTAGQERYKSLAPMYCRGSAVLVVVYDVNSVDSFEESKKWCNEFRTVDVPQDVYYVGNKIDLPGKVDEGSARDFVASINARFHRTSAQSGEGIQTLFDTIAEGLINRPRSSGDSVLIGASENSSKKDGCC